MSDPQYRDARDEPLREEEIRSRRASSLSSNNAMWGWVAGAIVLALVVVFMFARGQTNTASNTVPTSPPASTTGMAPPKAPAPSTNPAPAATPAPTPAPLAPSR